MALLEVEIVHFRSGGRVAALLADIDLLAAFLVRERELESVNLAAVRLERTALGERFVAVFAAVRSDS